MGSNGDGDRLDSRRGRGLEKLSLAWRALASDYPRLPTNTHNAKLLLGY